jgi:hypothetical protein
MAGEPVCAFDMAARGSVPTMQLHIAVHVGCVGQGQLLPTINSRRLGESRKRGTCDGGERLVLLS